MIDELWRSHYEPISLSFMQTSFIEKIISALSLMISLFYPQFLSVPPQKSGYAAFVELPNIDSKIHSIFPHTSNIGPCDFLKVLDIFKFILQLHQLSSKSLLSVSLATPTLQFLSWLVLMEITPGMGHSWFELWKFQISRNSLSWAMVYNWWLDSLSLP